MCGIVGYIGNKESKNILLEGLKELEYRGYDSAGIAILQNDSFTSFKALGKLKNLDAKMEAFTTSAFSVGIGHTRWATHGKPTELNAHPHLGESSYVVHNGIIENYQELKKELQDTGVSFLSQTDTEVIVHLFENNLRHAKSSFEAFENTLKRLEGAYAILLVHKGENDTILFAKNGSPMILATDHEGDVYFASSDAPLIGKASNVIYLDDGQYGYVKAREIHIFDAEGAEVHPSFSALPTSKLSAQKEGYRFFMEKEIYEQSDVLLDTLLGRLSDEEILFDEIDANLLQGIDEIKLCACGTSYHAALTASYLFEREAKIRCSVEIASEFRYKDPILCTKTLFIVISQSGETADTLETLKMAKEAGLKTLVVCNVDNSSMVRLADAALLTRAGIEKGVASTKAFATQVTLLWMLALYTAKTRNSIS
ncbi:MAG: glutamine--fructose-6-phosphate transaminase (isomerizing), partial [Sulfurimonas sp.]